MATVGSMMALNVVVGKSRMKRKSKSKREGAEGRGERGERRQRRVNLDWEAALPCCTKTRRTWNC